MLAVAFVAVLCALVAPSLQQNSAPVFVETLQTLLEEKGLYENTTVGSTIGSISCSDPDGDQVAYFVVGSSSLGIRDFLSGEVFLLRALDREQSVNSLNPNEKPNSLQFQCVDFKDGQQLSLSRTTVDTFITVLDNNDNAPVFSAETASGFSFFVKESDPVGTVLVGKISITDEDNGKNAKLDSLGFTCTNADLEPCQYFRLVYNETDEGKYSANIVLQKKLDYESRIDYRTSLTAIDGPGNQIQLTSSIGIRIVVEDSQDTDPIFTNQNYNFDVTENLGVGSSVQFGVSARDGDSGAKRRIALEVLDDPSGYNLFETGTPVIIDTVRGIYQAPIMVKTEIDRENPQVANGYSFVVKAVELESDGNRTTATATARFTVNIKDVNDNSPLFTQSFYNISVPEMEYVNSSAVQIPNLQIEVNDPDEPSNARYELEIIRQSFGAFGFTPVGQVSGQQFFYLTVNNFQYMDYDQPEYRKQEIVLKAVEYLASPSGQQRSSTATVSVYLTDINDNFPSFERETYQGSVVENAVNFTSILTVSASDSDSGSNGEFEYQLESRVKDLFYIEPRTGVIHLVGPLDYEKLTEYSFLALSVDKAPIPKTSQALVRIRVTDFNDVGPQFELPVYSARVLESSTSFESPVIVKATDSNDPDARITYRIVSGNTNTNSFIMNADTGELTLRETVNYDRTPNREGRFTLIVEASDNGVPPVTARAEITVTVIDENNNTPVFNPVQYSKTVSEAISKGTEVLSVTATDADFGSNGEISYRIGSGSKDNFVVNGSGTVFISNNPSFDRDDYGALQVEIIAVDGGSPQRSATAIMSITITDANNKPPVFLQSLYNTIVDEATTPGTSVLQVSATDPDITNTLRYSIPPSTIAAINKAGSQVGSVTPYDFREAFKIDLATGVISVGAKLDRSYVVEMSFEVVVRDLDPTAIGDQNAKTRVTITIRGTQNTELYFNLPWSTALPKYDVPMLESSPIGTEIMTLQARDPADDDSVLTLYEEVPNTDSGDFFTVTTKTDTRGVTPGVVALKRQLDYESNDLVHSVVIRAIKPATGNLPARTVTATVEITVQDFNDNRPEFTRARYQFRVREDAQVNTEVGTIIATDLDSASFGPIEFSLGGGINSDDFKLIQTGNDGSAQLLVAKPLNYERVIGYSIDVIARDNEFGRGSAIRLDSKAAMDITIIDVNDNTPQFTDRDQIRSFSVPETASIQTVLGQLLATDLDFGLNGRVTYRLISDGSVNGVQGLQLFSITPQSGALVTRASLRGLGGGYNLVVVAQDSGIPPRSASLAVTIKVQGAEDDDGTPQWLGPVNNFVTTFPEHQLGTLDVTFSALPRSENSTTIEYRLVEFATDYRSFVIYPVTGGFGKINVTAELDREVQESYTLVIEAIDIADRLLISRRTLIVRVTDIDDHAPSFQKSNYTACPTDFKVPTEYSVMDKTPAGTIVGKATACDPDGPEFNKAVYYLYTGDGLCAENHSGRFVVNENGTIESALMLNYEDAPEFLVCVEVRAAGSQPRVKREFSKARMIDTSRIAYVVIKIIDVNDNGPSFPSDSATAVLETIPRESTVTQVTATDPDGPRFGQIRYDITGTMFYPGDGGRPYSLKGAFSVSDIGEITINRASYTDFAGGYFLVTVTAFDLENSNFNDSVVIKVIMYQRSQLLRVVLNIEPAQGLRLAPGLIAELNAAGSPSREFFFKAVSEHRTRDTITPTQTDICFVLVENENKKAYETSPGLNALNEKAFQDVLDKSQYAYLDTGTCYPLQSSSENVKWRDLWWVLVVIAIFIFVCTLILIITTCILYDRYRDYMTTSRVYMVPQ